MWKMGRDGPWERNETDQSGSEKKQSKRRAGVFTWRRNRRRRGSVTKWRPDREVPWTLQENESFFIISWARAPSSNTRFFKLSRCGAVPVTTCEKTRAFWISRLWCAGRLYSTSRYTPRAQHSFLTFSSRRRRFLTMDFFLVIYTFALKLFKALQASSFTNPRPSVIEMLNDQISEGFQPVS